MRVALGLIVVLAAASCRTSAIYSEFEREMGVRALHPPPNMTCKDGRAVKLIVGSTCNMGICGWSCSADRWADEEPAKVRPLTPH